MRGQVSLSFMGIPPTIEVANLGMADSLILMVMALVVFGPRRLPQIGRQIGKLMYEFRKASNDFKFQMEEELRNAEEADRRKKEEEERQRQLAANPPAQLEAGAADARRLRELAAADSTYPYGEHLRRDSRSAGKERSDAIPRIQPPSTGEPVPAAWRRRPKPARPSRTQEPSRPSSRPKSSSPAEKENAVIETAVEDANKATEPAATMVDPADAIGKARQAVTQRADLPGMSLMEHLDELRKRIVHSAIYLAVGFFVAYVFHEKLYGFVQAPLDQLGKSSSTSRTPWIR